LRECLGIDINGDYPVSEIRRMLRIREDLGLLEELVKPSVMGSVIDCIRDGSSLMRPRREGVGAFREMFFLTF